MSKSRVFASAALAGVLVIAGLSAGPAFAEDAPVWSDAPNFPIITPDYTVGFQIAETLSDPFGMGYTYSKPLSLWLPEFVNTTNHTLVVGLGVDLGRQGVVEPLWEQASWGIFADEGIHTGFRIEVASGGQLVDIIGTGLPRWPGHTGAIYLFDETQDPVTITEIARYTAPGGFVPINMNERQPNVEYLPTIGQELKVAGSAPGAQIFPGLTATATASGLPAGELVDLWIAPNFDFFFFHLLGAVLPADARKVGTGLVAPDGSLAATFEMPADLAAAAGGTPYQLVAGVDAQDYWPAGTWGGFDVFPLDGLDSSSVDIIGGALDAQLDVGAGVELRSPDGLPEMNVTATASAIGPSISGFSLAGTAPLFYHLSSKPPLEGPVQVCIPYENADGPVPSLYHLEEVSPGTHVWVDITDPEDSGGGVVCGTTTSFSPFVAGFPDPFDFSGFFSPVSMTAENIAKPGQAIPVKFSLHGDQGLDVVTSARFVAEGNTTSLVGEVIDTTTAGASGLSYDPVSDQYTYVWKTPKTLSLKKGYFELSLSDGTTHTFDVTFKK